MMLPEPSEAGIRPWHRIGYQYSYSPRARFWITRLRRSQSIPSARTRSGAVPDIAALMVDMSGTQDQTPIVIIDAMNAVERYWAASKARDVSAAVSELSPDVVMLTPASDEPLVGRDAVATALRAVESACDEFRHTHLLADDQGQLFGLVFEAKVGEETMRGVDMIELDDRDRIITFTVFARPLTALMALGARMGQGARPG